MDRVLLLFVVGACIVIVAFCALPFLLSELHLR